MIFEKIKAHAEDVHRHLAERNVHAALASFAMLSFFRGRQIGALTSDIEYAHARQLFRDAQIALSTLLVMRLEGAA